MIATKFDGAVLEVNTDHGNRRFDLGHKIGSVLTTSDDYIIVRFDLVGAATPERNIICLDKSGKNLWTVEDPGIWRVGKKSWPSDQFGSMTFNKNGDLWAHGGESKYRIDIKTGKILEEIYTK